MTDESNRSETAILHVEDNPADARLLEEGFSAAVCNRLHWVRDGAEALEFLEQQPPYVDAPRPDLVLLDLNLPRRSGIEVLERIKRDDDLKQIPVLVLTSSDASNDIEAAYRHHANAYLVKPVDIGECESLAAQIERFWLHTAKLVQPTDDI
ncbi:MAG: response regulator [Halobellus sp.]|uniref:response regulator n=1 Tax=Halobellus sp. TaxID=1979212 RepID=UPI0035D3DE11